MKRRSQFRAVVGRVLDGCGRVVRAVLDIRFAGFLMRKVFRTFATARTEFLVHRRTYVSGALRVGTGTNIAPDADIVVGPPEGSVGSITLGRDVYIGRRVQLGVMPGNAIEIGDDTSIQDNTIILGDVRIGSHCLLAGNIFISSGEHFFRLFPTWLIRDQDALGLGTPEGRAANSRRVVIEDDVWIGHGVFIRRGVSIGRGAVLGAYAVVLHDVPPYSIQAGAPNREIGRRWEFAPPASVSATESGHHPYFYRGFLLQQAALARSVPRNAVFATRHTCVLLCRQRFRIVELRGILPQSTARFELRVLCSGHPLGVVICSGATWAASLAVDHSVDVLALPSTSPALGNWFEFEFQVTRPTHGPEPSERSGWPPEAVFGLSEVRLIGENTHKDSPAEAPASPERPLI